jgi:hypothetical protein
MRTRTTIAESGRFNDHFFHGCLVGMMFCIRTEHFIVLSAVMIERVILKRLLQTLPSRFSLKGLMQIFITIEDFPTESSEGIFFIAWI